MTNPLARHLLAAPLALLLCAPSASLADDPRPVLQPEGTPAPIVIDGTDEQGVVSGTRSGAVVAHVRAIDYAGRELTLHAEDGRVQKFHVAPEVRNLERINVGDRVNLRFREGLVLRYQPPGQEDATPEARNEVSPRGKGDVLSGTEVIRSRGTVTVTAVDPVARTTTFRGADGKVWVVKAGPGLGMEKVKVGDRFVATYSAALAVSVDPVYGDGSRTGPLPGG
ncbi:MAG TPA: hypothetical protein VFM53_15470 [Anaeromyxobacteraceae bacterium]|nr:hypothetical protein [Anaeromyxobacteraceae bacterium]